MSEAATSPSIAAATARARPQVATGQREQEGVRSNAEGQVVAAQVTARAARDRGDELLAAVLAGEVAHVLELGEAQVDDAEGVVLAGQVSSRPSSSSGSRRAV